MSLSEIPWPLVMSIVCAVLALFLMPSVLMDFVCRSRGHKIAKLSDGKGNVLLRRCCRCGLEFPKGRNDTVGRN